MNGECEWILLAGKGSYAFGFAEKIQKYFKEEKGVEVPLREVDISHFGNKEIKMNILENVRKKDVYFIHDSNKNPQEWWVELLLLKDLLFNSSAESITFVLPDMMYSRQDRKEKPHVPISARALAYSISSGIRRVITMDLHAPQIQGFYPQEVPLDNLYSFPVVVQHLKEFHPDYLKDLVIVSPDIGGTHRARAFLSRIEKENNGEQKPSFAIIDKTRLSPGVVGEMRLIGEVAGKDVLLIDDMIDSGGTLVKAGKLLKEKGAKRIICYATHGLFIEGTEKIKSVYDSVMTSNSHQQTDEKVEVVDVSHLFAEAIYRAQNGLSISKLFE